MEQRYKLILSNKRIYKEVEIPPENTQLRVGTTRNCYVRFSKENFFNDFELTFLYTSNGWQVNCDENVYLIDDGVLKLYARDLYHGDSFFVKYQGSDQEVFRVQFMIDFDFETKVYDRMIDISQQNSIRIGSDNRCHMFLFDELIGQDEISFTRKQDGWYVSDNNTQYGVYVNGIRVRKSCKVNDYDFFSIIGYSFYYKHEHLYTDANSAMEISDLPFVDLNVQESSFTYPVFSRSTRIKSVVPDEKVPILDPPGMPQKPKQNIVMSLLPILLMIGIMVLVRSRMSGSNMGFMWMSVAMMSVGIFTTVLGLIDSKRQFKKDMTKRREDYLAYLDGKRAEINKVREEELNILNERYFPSQYDAEMAIKFSSDLFNRESQDEDFLHVRLGLGPIESRRPVDFREQERFASEDDLVNLPEQISKEYKYISNGPVVLELAKAHAVGVIGHNYGLYNMLKEMTIDLVTRQFFDDVRLYYIVRPEDASVVEWLRMIPHVQNDENGMRNIVCDESSRNILFEQLYKELTTREEAKLKPEQITRRYVVFIFNAPDIKTHPIAKHFDKASNMGFTFIFFENLKENLPSGCSEIIFLENTKEQGMLVNTADAVKRIPFTYQPISDELAARAATRLAPVYCQEVSLESRLTSNITFYEMLNILSADDLDLQKRWNASRVDKSMAAPIGVKANDELLYLDLHEKYDGPHGLVAGTTGSGKSELVQSYILSMATLFHPYEVSFVIIDFKGGGMVNQFADLPHLNGSITNIDDHEIGRSLSSIKAELRKRQRLLAEANVNRIDAYINLFKAGEVDTPLPHLILVVDEFAELKQDQPDFMKELISAARIGRSLGVHLILATQKPSGVIDAQIWSNSKFKLCLKVQSAEDSKEVLKTPLAAEIKEVGRAYLQVGNNERFDLFQSAYSGAPSSLDETVTQEPFAINEVSLAGRKKPVFTRKRKESSGHTDTQLEALVEYVAQYCESRNIARLPGICLPPLAEVINYRPYVASAQSADAETVKSGEIILPIGIYDDPMNQLQEEYFLNLTEGSTFAIGASQFGKTALLQLLIRGIAERYSPEECAIYILDFSSMALAVFEELNHVGGVVTINDTQKLENFMKLIREELATRKERFSKLGITSYTSYREAGHSDFPQIIIMIDGIIALKELNIDLMEELMSFARDGLSVGVSLVMTNPQGSGISYRYTNNFLHRIAFYCNTRDEYGTLFERARIYPKPVPGRAIVTVEKSLYELQTYLAFEGEREIERVNKIHDFINEQNARYAGMHVVQIPTVPEELDMDWVEAHPERRPQPYCAPIGLNHETVEYETVNLLTSTIIGISGRPESGKTNMLRLIFEYLQANLFNYPTEAYIVDDFEHQLEGFKEYGFVEQYTGNVKSFDTIIQHFHETLAERLNTLEVEGAKGLEKMPLLLLVCQNKGVFTSAEAATGKKFGEILSLYHQLKVCFIFADVDNFPINYSSGEYLRSMKEKNQIFFFDDLQNLKLADLPMATLRANKKPIELGDCFHITDRGVQRVKTIHYKRKED